jgi:hypothetical protein
VNRPADNKDGGQDLAILEPDRHAVIGGVAVVMREYTFAESLRLHALITALTDAMTGVALAGDFNDLDSLRGAFGDNAEHVMQLIAVACDQPLAWVQSLSADDGDALQMLWWAVNDTFFLRRVLLSVQLHKVRELDGLTSSPPSSAPGMTRETSPATPTVN